MPIFMQNERSITMLETKKSTTLTGTITVKDGDVDKQVVYLSANVTSDGAGNDNVNQTIQDRNLYKANKVQIRKDIAEFTNKFYEIQDAEVEE